MEWQNMRYSQEFKDKTTARLLSKELTVPEASEQFKIAPSTLYYWVGVALKRAGSVAKSNKGNSLVMTSLKLPKGVTYLQAHTAVNAKEFMSETDFGQFCRKHGYLASTVEQWADWFSKNPDAVNKKAHDSTVSALSEMQKLNAQQAREITRKDKALADAATMLLLSKKAEAIWGAKES